MKIIINSERDLPNLASKVLETYSCKMILLYGNIGVGKTTFIKVICSKLGVNNLEVSSPTYSLVNEYEINKDSLVYHFDFYRLNSVEDVYDLGYEDYFFSNHYCFVEWPEKIANLLPENHLRIDISTKGDKRIFIIQEIKL